jgi:Na+-transporting NADH:ubiquinone oxidoreductase subunit C
MNKYVQSLLFVVILGFITSTLLVGADLLTEERIIQNQEALLKSTILDANGIPYNFQNIHDVFAEEIVITNDGDYLFYTATSTANVSYQFEGGGVWGPIIGIITLEDDFETIVEISILEQEETPGLGGVVAERDYLDNYVGKQFTPEIIISKTANTSLVNEVDSITGATRTSDAFMSILNTSYSIHRDLYQGGE